MEPTVDNKDSKELDLPMLDDVHTYARDERDQKLANRVTIIDYIFGENGTSVIILFTILGFIVAALNLFGFAIGAEFMILPDWTWIVPIGLIFPSAWIIYAAILLMAGKMGLSQLEKIVERGDLYEAEVLSWDEIVPYSELPESEVEKLQSYEGYINMEEDTQGATNKVSRIRRYSINCAITMDDKEYLVRSIEVKYNPSPYLKQGTKVACFYGRNGSIADKYYVDFRGILPGYPGPTLV